LNSGLSDLDITAITMSPEGYIYLGTESGIIYRSVDIMSSINDKNPMIPSVFKLQQNYPNPFNPSTTLTYQLVKSSLVELKVYDVLGREITTLINNKYEK
jgi:hypothetical protein